MNPVFRVDMKECLLCGKQIAIALEVIDEPNNEVRIPAILLTAIMEMVLHSLLTDEEKERFITKKQFGDVLVDVHRATIESIIRHVGRDPRVDETTN